MKPTVWSKNSVASLQEIYDYIYFESPQNADLVINILFELGDKLNIFPKKIQLNHFSTTILSDFSRNGIIK